MNSLFQKAIKQPQINVINYKNKCNKCGFYQKNMVNLFNLNYFGKNTEEFVK